jgi:toxin YoeB
MNIQFSENAWEDYLFWQRTDKRIVKKISATLADISRGEPHEGIGKPEPLKHTFSEFWSRRITEEHRLVYKVESEVLKVVQIRYHY